MRISHENLCKCIGHSALKNGTITIADGTKFGGGNEYKYNKKTVLFMCKLT